MIRFDSALVRDPRSGLARPTNPPDERSPVSVSRTASRTLGVLATAAGLTLAGAGAAYATASTHDVEGDTVSVTFTLDGGLLEGDTCGALIATPSAATGLAADFTSGDLGAILGNLVGVDGVHVLAEEGIIVDRPVLILGNVGGAGKTSGTVSAHEVPANVYTLITMCTSYESPTVNPAVLVGDPVEAVTGSVQGSLGGDADGAGSSALLGVLGGGEDEGGPGFGS